MKKRNGGKSHSVKLVRTFDASPGEVYRAWTDPKIIRKWFAPQEMSTPVAEVHLKVGGKYRIGMKSSDGELYVATGVYRKILPNEKLVFTWRWESESSDVSDTLVTVEFKKSNEHTKLVFTHEKFATEESAKDHQEGWGSALSKLSTLMRKGKIGHGNRILTKQVSANANRTKGTTDKTEIRQVIDSWAKALRTKDAAGVVSHHAASFVHFSLAPPLITAWGVRGLKAWFSTWQGPIGYEISDLSITVGDDVAFSHSLNRLSGTKTDGRKSNIWFRQTLGFRRIGGEWKITHEHESVPFYMDGSLKAAVDLNP